MQYSRGLTVNNQKGATFRLSDEDHAILSDLSKQLKTTKTGAVRVAIREAFKKRSKKQEKPSE